MCWVAGLRGCMPALHGVWPHRQLPRFPACVPGRLPLTTCLSTHHPAEEMPETERPTLEAVHLLVREGYAIGGWGWGQMEYTCRYCEG